MLNTKVKELYLKIETPFDKGDAANFRLPSWPPAPDFPIVLDSQGNTVSRYSDTVWYLWPWAQRPLTINFGDGPQRKIDSIISKPNADILRLIAAWSLYSPSGANRPSSLLKNINDIKPIFKICTREGILVTDLNRHPRVLETISKEIKSEDIVQAYLHNLYEWREEIGLVILDPSTIKKINSKADRSSFSQTPYIPPRIWTYQVNKLREFLEDFRNHQNGVEGCFKHCVKIYTEHYHSLANAFSQNKRPPFSKPRRENSPTGQLNYAGSFSETAKKFGIHGLLLKWVGDESKGLDGPGRGVIMLSSYLNLTTHVGIAYILNFSMMRIQEAWNLRTNCLTIEHDSSFGPIYILSGTTTKTVDDDDARWITSPSTSLAIDVLTTVSNLRIACAAENPTITVHQEDLDTPWLVCRAYEPWAGAIDHGNSTALRPNYTNYNTIIIKYKNLFNTKDITIDKSDLELARHITTGLDEIKFQEGKPWKFAWHQLRRTGAINMQSSNLVSDHSIQYQLKHETLAMSLYYGKGYSRVRLNQSAKNEYISALYEMISKSLASLHEPKYISIHGNDRKDKMIRPLKLMTSKEIEGAVKKGAISWRPTALGGCIKNGPCPYGGVDNLIRCGGGDGKLPCVDGVIDTSRKESFLLFSTKIDSLIKKTEEGSPLQDSLLAQRTSVRNILEAIERHYEKANS